MHKAAKVGLVAVVSAAAAMASMPVASASAELVTNGGFESTPVSGAFQTYSAGADIGGWIVGGDSVDVIDAYWPAAEGTHSVDLSGNAPGSISQTLATTPGATYRIAFDISGNPDQADIDDMSVTWGGTEISESPFSFDSSTASRSDMKWKAYSADVVASGTSTVLTFASETGDAYGPALDNVSVTQLGSASTVTYAGASQGVYTNHGTTVVQQAQVTSDDPKCIAGRLVTFTINNTTQQATTDIYGVASTKYAVSEWAAGTYDVHLELAPSGDCQSDTDDAGQWVYKTSKK